MYWGLRSRFIRIFHFHFHRNLVFSYEMQRPVSSSFIGDRLKFVNFFGGPLTCNAAQGRKVRGIAARGRTHAPEARNCRVIEYTLNLKKMTEISVNEQINQRST